jgi:hypothetical protein
MPDGDRQGPSGQQQGGQQQEGTEAPLDFETWLAAQDEATKGLLDGHTKGLKGALDAERTQRKEFERQLRDAAKKLDKESETRKALEEQADKLGELEQQTAFYDAAHVAGVTNLRLAYLAARDAGLVDGSGRCDMGRLKAVAPELFGAARMPAGNAGAGTQQPPQQKGSMNDFIRRAAGRQP